MYTAPILDAAHYGDTAFLREAYRDNVDDLHSYFLGCEDTGCWNLLHVAVHCNRYSFLYEALNILNLHPSLVTDLICQPDTRNGCNPVHYVASGGNIFIVKLLVRAYARAAAAAGINQETPPWLRKDLYNNTPLRRSFFNECKSNEVIARYLVSLDQSSLKTVGRDRDLIDTCSTLILDGKQTSVVFNGMVAGCSLLVEQIIISVLPYCVNGNESGESPLHYASKCNEKVSRLLLERHPELIGKVSFSGQSVLERAVEDGATWLVKLMLLEDEDIKYTDEYRAPPWIKACRRLIWQQTDKTLDTPFHTAARKGNMDIAELLLQGYNSAIEDEATIGDVPEDQPGNDLLGADPLFVRNVYGQIPLTVALTNKHDDCGVFLSKKTFPLTSNYAISGMHWEALLAAKDNGCRQSRKTLLAIIMRPGSINSVVEYDGPAVLAPGVLKIFDYLFGQCQEMSEKSKLEEVERLSEVLPEFLGNHGKSAKTLLKEAAERGEDWLVRLFLESDKYLLMESTPAWQIACEKGNLSTLLTFIDFCDEEFVKLCQNSKQTPLHHIKLKQYGQYVELLKMPVLELLKNQIDNDGATPLHRAIQRGDLELTKALLETKGIDVSIKDNNWTTAFELLENFCKLSKRWYEQFMEVLKMPVVELLKNQVDINGATPLHRAIQRDDLDVTKLLLRTEGIDVSIKDKKGIPAFMLLENRCKFSKNWCRSILTMFEYRILDMGTTLDMKSWSNVAPHLVKLQREQYIELLKRPMMERLKNQTDSDGSTPLHRAIQREDLELTKALLEIKGIEVSIKNKHGTTAFALLENRCKFSKSWGKMCREIEQASTVEKLKYLFRKISFEGMQNTLSVVAALVATITFAAGITVPGGVNSNDGTAVLSTDVAFLVFSISNTSAMCSSIMVLILLLGPMMWDPQPPLFYVNLSLFLLLVSLGGTMLAFMTGVYATMVPKVKWNAIFVLVSCSWTSFLACIVLLSTYSPRFKDHVQKRFNWLIKVCDPNPALNPSQLLGSTTFIIHHDDTDTATSSSMPTPPIQPQPGTTNTSVAEASKNGESGNSQASTDDFKLEIKPV